MSNISSLHSLSKKDVHSAGGKGSSLGEMLQRGVNVPPGFVVLANAFEQFIDENQLRSVVNTSLQTIPATPTQADIAYVSTTIREAVLQARIPDHVAEEISAQHTLLDEAYVAVRSSATTEDSRKASWAGQFDSYLNTDKSALIEKVHACWASLYAPRAVFYRYKNPSTVDVSMAVVVQKMVRAESAGVAFSVHPVTKDVNTLVIEAGYGLGEAVVTGHITPDRYHVQKHTHTLIDSTIATQEKALFFDHDIKKHTWHDLGERGSLSVLTDAQVAELSKLVHAVETLHGEACDIEWAYESGQFYIVQSRPITTLC